MSDGPDHLPGATRHEDAGCIRHSQPMREPHAKCVKISPATQMEYAFCLGFHQKGTVAPPLLGKMLNRVDSVDGSSKVRGLFAKNKT